MPPVSKRVLCMHEDDDTCKTLTEPLTRLGHEVTSTASVSSALYVAAKNERKFEAELLAQTIADFPVSRVDRGGVNFYQHFIAPRFGASELEVFVL